MRTLLLINVLQSILYDIYHVYVIFCHLDMTFAMQAYIVYTYYIVYHTSKVHWTGDTYLVKWASAHSKYSYCT